MVALFHFDVFSHISFNPLVRHSYLFVDFFFVLSGFVITAGYRQRLIDGFNIGHFMRLRFWRLYPLHFFMILPFIPLALAKGESGPDLARTVLEHLTLTHGLGVSGTLALNFPSWSISAEFTTYLVFALVVGHFGRSLLPWIVPILVAPVVFLWLSPNGMDATFDFGFIRCLYGFALGVIGFDLYERSGRLRARFEDWRDSGLEGLVLGLTIAGVWVSQEHSVLAVALPFLFLAVVLTFAREGGVISHALTIRPLLALGALTYSIYMVHAFVRVLFRGSAMVAESKFGIQLFHPFYEEGAAKPSLLLGLDGSLWLGDILQMGMVATTITAAYFCRQWIEKPGQAFGRKFAMPTKQTAS